MDRMRGLWKDCAMIRTTRSLAIAAVLLLAITGGSRAAFAQDIADRELTIGLRYGSFTAGGFLGLLVNDNDVGLLALDVGARFRIADALWIGGQLPIAHMTADDDSDTILGNPTLQLDYLLSAAPRSYSWLETSLSLPLADDDGEGARTGLFHAVFWLPDPGLYLADTTTFRIRYRHHFGDDERGVELAAGLQHFFIDGDEDRTRLPLAVQGHLRVGGDASVVGRFSTFWEVSAEDDEDDFFHVLEAGLEVGGVGNGKLAFMLYLPLDDLYRDVYEAWGLSLAFRTAL